MPRSLDRTVAVSLPTPGLDPLACRSCAIRHRGLCEVLTPVEIDALNRIAQRRKLRPGEVFLVEGEDAVSFANITSGVAKLVRSLEDGREQIVGLLFPSDFMGRVFQKGSAAAPMPYTVQAASELSLCAFPSGPFEAILSEHPKLEHKLLERTLSELDAARDWMLLLGRKTAPERVATFLHHIATRCAEAGGDPTEGFDLPLTRADMADFIGLTIETVSRQITKLRKDGVIVLAGSRRIATVDMERLAARAGLR
ncbi:MAG: Crp/Fnr family transcriptional regulator [Devosia sp.]